MGVVRSCVMLPPDVSSPSNSSRSIGFGVGKGIGLLMLSR
jgi:hypothetical protein